MNIEGAGEGGDRGKGLVDRLGQSCVPCAAIDEALSNCLQPPKKVKALKKRQLFAFQIIFFMPFVGGMSLLPRDALKKFVYANILFSCLSYRGAAARV